MINCYQYVYVMQDVARLPDDSPVFGPKRAFEAKQTLQLWVGLYA